MFFAGIHIRGKREIRTHDRTMRKLIGTLAIVVVLALYAILALTVAIKLEFTTTGKFVAYAYYVIAGLLWVVPVGLIIWWMEKRPPEK